MQLGRRHLLQAPVALLPLALATPARADTTDLVVACDTALGPAISRVAAAFTTRTSVAIRLFPTSPQLLLPQLDRNVQNDILITQTAVLDQAERGGLLAAKPNRVGPWQSRLVLAAMSGTGRDAAAAGPIAVPDPTPAFPWDSREMLTGLGLKPNTVLGTIDTSEVAFLLTSGAAISGLLFMTELRADRRLDGVMEVPDAVARPIGFGAAISHGTSRPNPGSFLAFLGTPEANELLRAHGLEAAA